MYVPFLDQVISELKSRFGDSTVPVALQLNELLKGSKVDTDAIREAAQLCENDVESLVLIRVIS